jgi:hypothetical protein
LLCHSLAEVNNGWDGNPFWWLFIFFIQAVLLFHVTIFYHKFLSWAHPRTSNFAF